MWAASKRAISGGRGVILSRKPGKGYNWLSVLIGLALLVFWIYYVSILTCAVPVRYQHILLLYAFGAVFTLFLLKLACWQPAVVASLVGGLLVSIVSNLLLSRLLSIAPSSLLLLAVMLVCAAAVYFPLSSLMPARLNLRREEMAVIYTIVLIGTATAVIGRSSIHAVGSLWFEEWGLAERVPAHWLPNANAETEALYVDQVLAVTGADAVSGETATKTLSEGFLQGDAKVPWHTWYISGYGEGRQARYWTFPALFWTLLLLTFEFFFLYVALVFRKRWIEEDRLPFPMAQIPLAIINAEPDGADGGLFRKRLHWIAFAIGVALCLRGIISVTPTEYRPVVPQLSYLLIDPLSVRVDLTGYKIVEGLYLVVWLAPFALLCLLFVPVDVLMTAMVTWVVIQVVIRWVLGQLGVPRGELPGNIQRGMEIGGLAGLCFWTLVFQWKMIERLFVAFWRRTRGPGERRFLDARNLLLLFWVASIIVAVWIYPSVYGEGLTPLSRWLIVLGTILLFGYLALSSRGGSVDPSDDGPLGARSLLVLLAATGLSFIALTLPGRSIGLLVASSAIIFIYTFACMRARGETYMHDMYTYNQGRLDASVQGRYVPGPSAPGIATPHNHWWNTNPGFMSHFYTWQLGVFFRYWGPHNHFLGTFKLGHESGSSSRDIFKAICLALVVAAAVTPALTLFYSYTYGYGGRNIPINWYEDYITGNARAYIFGTSSMEPPTHYDRSKLYTWPVFGFLLIGVVMYMRREYAWFPLHPIGLLLGVWMYQPWGAMRGGWFTVLVAWLLKRQVFKWFGVAFFREKVRPVLLFALMGMVLGVIIYVMRFAIEYGIGVWQ